MRTRRARNWTIAMLGAAFALTALWGYGQMLSKNAVMMRAESQYGRAFHGLIAHSEVVESKLDQLLVTKSRRQIVAGLDDVRLQAFAAQEDLNQLPITTTPLPNLTVYFGRLKEVAQDLSSKVMAPSGGDLSEEDWRRLEDLRVQARYARDELTQLARVQQSGRMRWLDSERGSEMTYQGGKPHPLTRNLLRVDGGFQRAGRPSRKAEGTEPTVAMIQPRGLTGRIVSPQEALDKARDFLGTEMVRAGSLRYLGEVAGNFPTYHFEGVAAAGQPLHLDLSQRGGFPHWMTAERPVKTRALDEGRATARAREFLRSWGGFPAIFPAMEPASYEEYFNTAVVTLVPEQDGILMYPDSVRVKIALDNGEILAFTAADFLKNHPWEGRTLPEPGFGAEGAPQKVSSRLTVTKVARAVILNDRDQEVLTYEVRGRLGEVEYKVFVNAFDGTEEKIERMRK